MNFDLVVNLPTTNCLIYIDKFRAINRRDIRDGLICFPFGKVGGSQPSFLWPEGKCIVLLIVEGNKECLRLLPDLPKCLAYVRRSCKEKAHAGCHCGIAKEYVLLSKA